MDQCAENDLISK